MFNFSKKSKAKPQVIGQNAGEAAGIQPWSESNTTNQAVDTKLSALMEENGSTNGSPEPDKTQKKRKSSWLLWILAGVITGAGTSGYALYRGWEELEALVPENVNQVLIYTRPGTLVVEAADGTVIQEIGPVTHERVKIWQVPDVVSQAFVSSEDRRYYEHFGVDIQGVARAAYANFQAGEIVEGGSSITQQLARIVFLNQETTAIRKLKEMRLATKLEEQFTKEQILESYLNLVYLGSGAYGVADAAWVYFGKSLDELTLPETAMIAGLAPAPSIYSPFVNRQKALVRRNQVLYRMREDGFISEAALEQAIATPIETDRRTPKRLLRKYPYFSDYIQAELDRHLTPEQLAQGGIVVETTINSEWQEWAEEVLKESIENYGRYQNFKQAAIVTIDPRNGQIKTMVGGLDFENNQYNRVTQAQRQPGSTFKTFVYAAAIASGMSPDVTYVDKEFRVGDYRPKNYSGSFSNASLTLTEALTQSINTIALSVMMDVGWDPIINLAQQMGIRSEMQPTYSLALGSWEVNLLEITSAYGTLANRGVHQTNYGISRILDRDGKVIYEAEDTSRRAIDENSAAIVTSMLTKVVSSGTGRNADIGRPVAGKTGTTDSARDLWFIGYIPQIVTGVWIGNDDNQSTWGSSSTAARIWGDLMSQITAAIAVEDFPPLPNLKNRVGSITAQPLNQRDKRELSRNETKRQEEQKREAEQREKANRNAQSGNDNTASPTNENRGSGSSEGSGSSGGSSSPTQRPPRVRTPEAEFDYTRRSDTLPPFVPLEESAPAPSAAPAPAPAPTQNSAAPAPTPAPAPTQNSAAPAPATAPATAPAPSSNVNIPAPPVTQKKAPESEE